MFKKKFLMLALALLLAGLGFGIMNPQEVEAGCSTSISCEECASMPNGESSICIPTFSNAHCQCTELTGGCIAFGSCVFVNDPKI